MNSGVQVNPQRVIQILSGKVSALSTENAMLQARVLDLEDELQKLRMEAETKEKKAEKKPA